MNKILELQQILINSAKNIEYLQQNNVVIYTSVPNRVKMPYIKIIGIEKNSAQENCEVQTFLIHFFIATNGKNNYQIIEICENLSKYFSSKINNYILQNEQPFDIKIFNVYNYTYSIKEDLQNNMWYSNFSLNIDFI